MVGRLMKVMCANHLARCLGPGLLWAAIRIALRK